MKKNILTILCVFFLNGLTAHASSKSIVALSCPTTTDTQKNEVNNTVIIDKERNTIKVLEVSAIGTLITQDTYYTSSDMRDSTGHRVGIAVNRIDPDLTLIQDDVHEYGKCEVIEYQEPIPKI